MLLLYGCCIVVALILSEQFYYLHARFIRDGVHHKKLIELANKNETSVTNVVKMLLQSADLIQESAALKMELDRYRQQDRDNRNRNQERPWRPGL